MCAAAPAWDAARYTAVAEPLSPGLVGFEDPFIWVHMEDGGAGKQVRILSVLAHAQSLGPSVGALFVSADGGRSWARSPEAAYTLTVPGMAGAGGWPAGPLTFLRRERPELVFADAAHRNVTHILTGAMLGGRGPKKDWQLSFSVATRVGK